MYQTIKMPCRLLDLVSHLIVTVKVEDICNHVQRILVILNIRIQAGKIEAICKVVLVYLTEILITAGRDELYDIRVSVIR